MRLLLDTHVVLWQLSGERALGVAARRAIEAAAELAFSVVSLAEIGVKAAIGRLVVPGDLDAHVAQAGLRVLGLSPAMGLPSRAFPCTTVIHSTGCSCAQARQEGFTLVSADARLQAYDAEVLDPLD